jgi:phosphotransferase system  glucose/maltose/N-acetylglucosamine-specific IIC component
LDLHIVLAICLSKWNSSARKDFILGTVTNICQENSGLVKINPKLIGIFHEGLNMFMTTWGAWLPMLLVLLWLTIGDVVRSGSSVMAIWTDIHCVTDTEGCLSLLD